VAVSKSSGMHLRRLPAVLSAVALVAVIVPTVALAKGGSTAEPTIRAGVGIADATWNVGAAAGQYANENTSLAENLLGGGEVDPHAHSRIKEKSYGVHSRLSVRAIVVEALDGRRVALLKSDNYLAQDLLLRRAGQLLAEVGSGIGHEDILHTASHNHSSPYYTTTSPGVFIFQDVVDQRMFEYQARAIRDAVVAAEADLQPARMAATTVPFSAMKANVVGPATADDGSPAGYPREFGDTGLVVMRFDSLVPAGHSGRLRPGDPIAVWMNFGEHPESLDGYGLTTGDFLAPLERFVERAVGAPLVFSQGDVGSAEGPYERADTFATLPDGTLRAFAHSGYAQMERGAKLMADAVVAGFEQADSDAAQVPWSSSFEVQALTAWVPGPLSHPVPTVGNCRSETTLEGNPGIGVAPDCERAGAPTQENPVVNNLELHGVPVPDGYGAPGYPAVEENLRLKLQVFRFGEVLLASCACEAQVDLILNLESRANDVAGDIFDGYDWCPDDGRTTCGGKPMDDPAIVRMKAQVHNDAAGWDAPENLGVALSEPVDPAQILGNFTKEELPAERGFALPVGIGHAGDYNGYTVSYREYQSRDHYRKALTAYGPHTADYMVTRLVRMAGSLKGGPELAPELHDAAAQADEARQEATAQVIGRSSGPAYDAWRASLPADVGPVEAVTQPLDLQRFDATTFTWRGGSNAVDNPDVRVDRLVDGAWQPFADMTGEVQTQVRFPDGVEGVADTHTGSQEWLWTAAFEAYSGFPAHHTSTPAGTYRFVVDGISRTTGADAAYSLTSEDFEVTPWDGVAVTDGRVDAEGDVSFVAASAYPRTWSDRDTDVEQAALDAQPQPPAFRTIRDDKNRDGQSAFCRTCSFRPWAQTAATVSAVVTVTRADGAVELVEAALVDSRWVADTNLTDGDTAVVAVGGVRDAYGETNGTALQIR
jgi:hypothetical protein